MPKQDKKIAKFLKSAAKAKREEEVLDAYAHLIGAPEWPRPFGSDGLACDALFEGKLNKGMGGEDGRKAMAQGCYYLRHIQKKGIYKGEHYSVPSKLAVVDKNEGFVVPTSELEKFFSDNHYDWSLPASSPDKRLVEDLYAVDFKVHSTDNDEGVKGFLAALQTDGKPVAQHVTRENFVAIFEAWKQKFADGLGPQEAAKAFILDLQKDFSVNETRGIILYGSEHMIKVKADTVAHKKFWSSYALPPDAGELSAILKRKDWLVVMQTRRSQGEFFTHEDFAKLGRQRILEIIPDAYENWNWYDPCCGTANLEVEMPNMNGRLFMSTLNQEDVDMINGCGMADILGAKVFQYDFLNQADEELPKEFLEKMTPGSKWVFYLNPPFVAGTSGIANGNGDSAGSSDTKTGNTMESEVGYARQNLIAQFLWRIRQLILQYKLNAVVASFHMSTWLGGDNFAAFRKAWLKTFEPKGGFCFNSKEFEGATGEWPVAMSIWRSKDV